MTVTARLGIFALAALAALGVGYGVGRLVADGETAPAHTVHEMDDR